MNLRLLIALSPRRITVGAFVLAASVHSAVADPVVDWNTAMTHYSEIQPPPGIPPFLEARAYAMAHIAMRDAVTAHGVNNGISNEAALAQAAHDVLVVVLPGGTSDFDTLLAKQLAVIPAGLAKTRGIQIGATEA